ncbi:MAG: hypothetical protein V4611_05100 [Patescibacteria group bacterium]
MNNSRVYTTQRAKDFLNSPEGEEAYANLLRMVSDVQYSTEPTYSPSSEDGRLLFIDKHMNYLCSHTGVNAMQYVSNLQLITKIRT